MMVLTVAGERQAGNRLNNDGDRMLSFLGDGKNKRKATKDKNVRLPGAAGFLV